MFAWMRGFQTNPKQEGIGWCHEKHGFRRCFVGKNSVLRKYFVLGFVWSCSVSATCLMHVRSVLLTCNNHGVKIIYLCSTVHGNSHITGIWGKSTRRLAISLGRKTMVQSIATAIATGVVEEALLQIIEPWGHGFQDSKKTMKQKLELSCVWECGIHPLYPFLWQSHGGNVWTCDLG